MAKQTVQDIIVDRLIKKINREKRLPWQKPFQSACMNWFSNREYMGINKILLDGGEYITPKQIEQYNERNKTNFWFEKGTPYEVVVFYSRTEKKITAQQAQEIKKQPWGARTVFPTDDGWVKISWVLRYYRVYNIKYIRELKDPELRKNPEYSDGVYKKKEIEGKRKSSFVLEIVGGVPVFKDGVSEEDINKLEPKIGNTIIEEHTPADEIVDRYLNATGVGLHESPRGAYYIDAEDNVFLPPKPNFASTEAYYRVLFHELTHSTGITERLNRSCFHKYHDTNLERSKEELVAEVGSLLLASEAGFREDTEWVDNSENYIAGWCNWMKDNKGELLNGLLDAEKAKNFILSGGVKADASSDRSIDNPNEKTEDSDVDTEQDEQETSTTSPTSTSKPTPKVDILELKTKVEVRDYYNTHLEKYFDESTDEEGRKAILKTVKGKELQHIYKLLSGNPMPKVRLKADAISLIRKCIEEEQKIT